MAITPFVFSPFGNTRAEHGTDRCATELAFTKNFDITKPAVMVFFAHGHEAILERDILKRQKVLEQLEKAGLNAVLVAPQLAYNKALSSPGRFAEKGFAKKYFDEAAMKLAQMHDEKKTGQLKPNKDTIDTFKRMPIMMVSYSGGYGASNAILDDAMSEIPAREARAMMGNTTPADPTLNERIKGVVSLDNMYENGTVLKQFASQPHRPFLVSNFIKRPARFNQAYVNNMELKEYFASQKQLTSGVVNAKQNVHIYEVYGKHRNLVQEGLPKALSYISGYRIDAPSVAPQKQDDRLWSPSKNPTIAT